MIDEEKICEGQDLSLYLQSLETARNKTKQNDGILGAWLNTDATGK